MLTELKASPPSMAQRLDGDPEVLFKPDRVLDVPAVHAVPQLGAVEAVRPDHLVHSYKRR